MHSSLVCILVLFELVFPKSIKISSKIFSSSLFLFFLSSHPPLSLFLVSAQPISPGTFTSTSPSLLLVLLSVSRASSTPDRTRVRTSPPALLASLACASRRRPWLLGSRARRHVPQSLVRVARPCTRLPTSFGARLAAEHQRVVTLHHACATSASVPYTPLASLVVRLSASVAASAQLPHMRLKLSPLYSSISNTSTVITIDGCCPSMSVVVSLPRCAAVSSSPCSCAPIKRALKIPFAPCYSLGPCYASVAAIRARRSGAERPPCRPPAL